MNKPRFKWCKHWIWNEKNRWESTYNCLNETMVVSLEDEDTKFCKFCGQPRPLEASLSTDEVRRTKPRWCCGKPVSYYHNTDCKLAKTNQAISYSIGRLEESLNLLEDLYKEADKKNGYV